MQRRKQTYRLVFSVLATFLTIIVTALAVINTVTVVGHDYFTTFNDKHARLSGISGPKVVVVGGSNTTFGYASEEFEKELGMDAVNMGLHANFGLRFMLSEVRAEIDSGDIVIISPEYEQFTQDYIDGDLILGEIALTQFGAMQYLDHPQQYIQLLTAIPGTAQKAVISNLHSNRELDPMYLASAFNRYGDIEISSGISDLQYRLIPQYAEADINPTAIELLEAFSKEVTERQARCIFTYPSIPDTFYTLNKPFLTALEEKLQGLEYLQVVNTPGERIHPASYCYDTHYHLRTKQMRKESTRRVIQDIFTRTAGTMFAHLSHQHIPDTASVRHAPRQE